jgi:hypothetical protein
VGNGWYLCSITFTATTGTAARVYASPANTVSTFAGDGTSGIFVWGAQIEPVTYQTTPGTYNATTSAAYYGPRFDYDPVTLAAKGLLIEEQRTNLIVYSQQFDDANWGKSEVTVTANVTASPDGTTNADKLVESTANSLHTLIRNVTTTAVPYTWSCYIKAAERTFALLFHLESNSAVSINLLTGETGTPSGTVAPTATTVTNAGNGWYRLTMTATATAASNSFRIYTSTSLTGSAVYTGNGTSGIFLYGAQLEAGAFATSYIPTVASQVTRSADVATMTGTNFSSWYNQSEGTLLVEASLKPNISGGMAALSIGSAIENMAIYSNPGAGGLFFEMRDNNTMQAAFTVALGSQPVKAAAAYATNNTNLAQNGTAQTTDTSCTVPTVDRLLIGAIYAAGDYPTNGHIRQIAYYNTRLPNATLQALTA